MMLLQTHTMLFYINYCIDAVDAKLPIPSPLIIFLLSLPIFLEIEWLLFQKSVCCFFRQKHNLPSLEFVSLYRLKHFSRIAKICFQMSMNLSTA